MIKLQDFNINFGILLLDEKLNNYTKQILVGRINFEVEFSDCWMNARIHIVDQQYKSKTQLVIPQVWFVLEYVGK